MNKNNIDKPIQIFGDESHSNGMVTYAFIIVPTLNLIEIEKEVIRVKEKYGIAGNEEIHCKHLMHEDSRNKTAFFNLKKDEIFDLLQEVSAGIYSKGARGWVGYLNNSTAPDIMYFMEEGAVRPESWDISDIKLKMLFAYQAALAPLLDFVTPSKLFIPSFRC